MNERSLIAQKSKIFSIFLCQGANIFLVYPYPQHAERKITRRVNCARQWVAGPSTSLATLIFKGNLHNVQFSIPQNSPLPFRSPSAVSVAQ